MVFSPGNIIALLLRHSNTHFKHHTNVSYPHSHKAVPEKITTAAGSLAKH
jgi:hypothetical protein